jgi:cysteine dioxygenase
VSGSALHPYQNFRDDRYTRSLVHRSDLFDVMVLCWRPGQATPVHNHSGQRGWVRVLRGAIEETTYRSSHEGDADLSIIEIDDEGVGHNVFLEELGQGVLAAGPGVVTADRTRAIHRIGNPAREDTVTLHVYSRPHDCCLVFDPAARTCRRKELVFDYS